MAAALLSSSQSEASLGLVGVAEIVVECLCVDVYSLHSISRCAFSTAVPVAILHSVIMFVHVALQIQRPIEADVCSFTYLPGPSVLHVHIQACIQVVDR